LDRADAAPVMDGDALRIAGEWAIMSHRGIRAFLPTPVPRGTVESMLDVARFATSGVNSIMRHGRLLDYDMFLQYNKVAARALGLSTGPHPGGTAG